MVRLVQDGDLDVGERAGPPLEQVDEPAWCRHHDVGVPDPGDLRADRHAPVDRGDADAHAAAQRRERVGDLLGELAGRDQDQAAGGLLAPPARAGREPGQQREAEGQRLARPGLSAAEHVAAGQRVGQRPGLDRERLADVTRRERAHQPGVQAELGERGRGGLRRRGGGVQGQVKLGIRFGAPWPWGLRVLLGRRPARGAWWRAHRRGRSHPKTREDAWNYGACRNSIGSSGVACSTDVNENGERLT